MSGDVGMMKVNFSSCHMISSEDSPCPLCKQVIPAFTHHSCSRSDPWKDTPQPPGSKEAAAAAERLKNKPPAKKKKRQ